MADLEGLNKLAECAPDGGYFSSLPKDAPSSGYMVNGSENAMISGAGKVQAFKGVTQRASVKGGFVMQNIVETFGSIGQNSEDPPDGTAYGNVFNVFAALFFIGKGLVRLAGISMLVNASATLQLLIKRNGSYLTDPLSGPWQAGLAAPSAPVISAIDPPGGFTGQVTGTISGVIWRIRTTTGAVSNQSPVSNIITCNNQCVEFNLPLLDANGQDAWGIGVTKQIEGRTGSHFEIKIVLESELGNITVGDLVTNVASLNLTSVTGGFDVSMIGWVVQTSGGSPDCSYSTYITAVPDANTITVFDLPPVTSTGVDLMIGSRKVVVEYRDGDLVGRRFAPSRSYPPPNGLMGGTIQDLAFIDGCYADAAAFTGESNPGSAIAPSEPGKPESYSPDTVIFTSGTPTGLLKGDGVIWRFNRNGLHVIRYLGGEQPLSVDMVWEGTGIQFANQACTGEGGRLYLWPSNRGLLRMDSSGMPEGIFAAPITDDLIGCTDASKRCLGWDGISHVVAVGYEQKIWPFFTDHEKWGAPADLSGTGMGNIRSMVPENNQLLITDEDDDLWEYNVGNGSIMKVRTPWIRSARAMDTVAAILASVRADNTAEPVIVRVLADGNEITIESEIEIDLTRTGFQRLPTVWPNVIDCESHAIEIEITSTTPTGDCGVEHIETYGPSHSTLR